MKEEKIILPTSPDAAQLRTVTGWVSRDGRFFGREEGVARYAGSTHIVCECGKVTEKRWTACEDCRAKSKGERFAKLKRQEWNGTTPLYSEALDEFLMSVDDIEDAMVDGEREFDDLRPLICRPNIARIDTDNFADDIAEDGDVPGELEDAIEAFNTAVEGVVMSWSPTDVVATWKDAPKLKELLDDGK